MKVLVVSILIACTSYATACDLHPKHWCDSVENAIKCNVYEQCKSMLNMNFEMDSTNVVYVTTYYESLCPDSINFIRQQLNPTWLKLKDSGIMKLRVVPYGKSCTYDNHGTYTFICQHGKDECFGNLIENCLIKYGNSDPEIYFPVIHCMSTAPSEVLGNAEKCISTDKNYNYQQIMHCANGTEGSELTHKSGVETHALSPSLYSVPWVNINGVHTDSNQEKALNDLLALVCDSYTGAKPSACNNKKYLGFDANIMR